MSEIIKELFDAARDRWHTRTGLIGITGAVAVSLIIAFAGLDLEAVTPLEWGIVITAILGVCTVWRWTRIPRAPKGKVGFGVAIEFEDTEHAKRLRSDFVLALRELLIGSQHRHQFSFQELPNVIARRIVDFETATKIAVDARLHFLLYGRARLRPTSAGPAHVIDLHGLVRHAPLAKSVSRKFGADFATVFPNRLVAPDGNIAACEVAAKHVDAVARYLIGTASALSGDFRYAEELLLGAEVRLKNDLDDVTSAVPIESLLSKVRERLGQFYEGWLVNLLRRYTRTREREPLEQAQELIPKLRRYSPKSYVANLGAATCAFVLRRDVEESKREILACKGTRDATWQYNEAFLYAYDGDLEQAYRSYVRAFDAPLTDESVPAQTEEFIQIVLDEEPDRVWLYYCLGLINHRAKGDLEAARNDFGVFIERADAKRFGRQIEIAQQWIRQLAATLEDSKSSH